MTMKQISYELLEQENQFMINFVNELSKMIPSIDKVVGNLT